jgi:hydrogenase expression/formation protein HypC
MRIERVSDDGKRATASFAGNEMEISVALVSPKIGDFVLVHAGAAIEILKKETAAEMTEIFAELASEAPRVFDALDKAEKSAAFFGKERQRSDTLSAPDESGKSVVCRDVEAPRSSDALDKAEKSAAGGEQIDAVRRGAEAARE